MDINLNLNSNSNSKPNLNSNYTFSCLEYLEYKKYNIKLSFNSIFWLFCLAHILFWTVIPYMVRGNIPFDTLEGIAWGQNWQWGYDKHPPLAAWFSQISTWITGYASWPIYLVAQISNVIMFWAVWKLAQKMFSPVLALISVLLLEGIFHYNFSTPNFNPNSIQAATWALLTYFFYEAILTKKLFWWSLSGFMAAMCLLAKYECLLLFGPMFIVSTITPAGRSNYKNINLYIGFIVFLISISPHLYWSVNNGNSNLYYLLNRMVGFSSVSNISGLMYHFFYVYHLLLDFIAMLIPCLLMMLVFCYGNKNKFKSKSKLEKVFVSNINNYNKFSQDSWESFNIVFIWIMGLGSFALLLLFSLITGNYINWNWALPCFFLTGMILVVLFRPNINKKKFNIFMKVLIFFFFLPLVLRYGGIFFTPYLTNKATSRVYIPYENIANYYTDWWNKKTNTALSYVSGDHYLVAAVSSYSKDRPKADFLWPESSDIWIDREKAKKHGRLFLVFGNNKNLINNLHAKYKNSIILKEHKFLKTTKAKINNPYYIVNGLYIPPDIS